MLVRRLFVLLALCAVPSTAQAAPVLVLGARGHVVVREDRFLPAVEDAPASGAARARFAAAAPRRPRRSRRRHAERTVRSELLRLYHARAIDLHSYHRYRAGFERALTAVKRLSGTRAYELQSVVTNLHEIAAAGLLTPSRLPVLFLTLDRNRQWWTNGPLLSSGQRVEFDGSQLVWEYYPGQGIELQELGSFGKADGLYTAGPAMYPQMRALLAELIPLAARRGGGIAWEYYFSFDGGSPPWTSAMSQGTALEALTRAYLAFGDPSYLAVARQALPVLSVAPPVGVSLPSSTGRWYLLYSFAPGALVINGFLQTLIGLYDYAHASGDTSAAALFAAGDARARLALPSYDTGGWSLYQPGVVDSLDYHTLVTGFLRELCARTGADVYCSTAARFDNYLKTPAALALLTHNTAVAIPTVVRFTVNKPAHVGIVVVRPDGTTAFATSADFDGGSESFSIGTLSQRGTYTVRLAATDLAGNFGRIVDTLTVH